MKISHFPDFLPDETVFSVASRYLDRMQFHSHSLVSQHFFQKSAKGVVTDFPANIEHLIQALPPNHIYTSETVIDQHTLLPFYSPFLPNDRVATLRQRMKTGGVSLHSIAGVTKGKVSRPQWLRYCPACINYDRLTYGECYWHRIHQIPGVLICPIHEVILKNSNVNMLLGNSFIRYCSAEQAVSASSSLVIPVHFRMALIQLAHNAKWLLDHPISIEPSCIQQQYLGFLLDHGLATATGYVRYALLKKALLDYYSPNLLETLGCNLVQPRQNWLTSQDIVQHPLYHLLVIQFLCRTTQEFFTKSRSLPPDPFGNGPWPCLNPLCVSYKEHVIRSYTSKQGSQGRPVATFACKCGFTYSRTGPDIEDSAVFRVGKVSQYGDVWDLYFTTYWSDPNLSISQIARLMHTDIKTVRRQAARLGLPFPTDVAHRGERPKIYQDYIDGQRDSYRLLWEDTLKTYPNGKITEITKISRNAHSWLKKHDNDWLKEHLPAIKPTISEKERLSICSIQSLHSKYLLIDADLAILVRKIGEERYMKTDFPVQVTRTFLISQVSRYSCLCSPTVAPKFLPLTAAALNETIETKIAFTWRKLRWAVRSYLMEQILPSYPAFRVRAHIDVHVSNYPAIKELIRISYDSLRSGSLLSEQMPRLSTEVEGKLINGNEVDQCVAPGSLAEKFIKEQLIQPDIARYAKWKMPKVLVPILLLSVAAVVNGAETCHAIAIWGYQNEALLCRLGLSKSYFTSYYTLRRIYAAIDAHKFDDILELWLHDTFSLIQNDKDKSQTFSKSPCVPGLRLLRLYRHIASEVVAKLC